MQRNGSDNTEHNLISRFCRHLYLELRKISCELNSIFGLQMTVKMGIYFAFIALGFRQLFNLIFVNFYINKTKLYVNIVISFLVVNIFRLLIINYMCEKVSIKVSTLRSQSICTCTLNFVLTITLITKYVKVYSAEGQLSC